MMELIRTYIKHQYKKEPNSLTVQDWPWKTLTCAHMLLFLFLYGMFLCISQPAKAFENLFYSSDKLTSTQITCIGQDKYGFIWIGTENGLNRFDGYRFLAFYHSKDKNSLPHNNITSLLSDKQGNMWIGTARGIARYDYARNGFEPVQLLPDSKSVPSVSCLFEDGDQVLVGTAGYGLYSITTKEGKVSSHRIHTYTVDGKDDFYQQIFVDPRHRFWYMDNTNTIYCIAVKGGKPHLVHRQKSAWGLPIKFVLGSNGDVLVVCDHAVLIEQGGQLVPAPLQLGNLSLKGACRLPNGNVLLGTMNNGIYCMQKHKGLVRDENINSLSIDVNTTFVDVLFVDREENIWMGFRGKGVMCSPTLRSMFVNWNLARDGFKEGSAVTFVCQASNNSMWVTLHRGVLYHFSADHKLLHAVSAPQNLYFVYKDHRGGYWMGAGTTLYRFDDKTGAYQRYRSFDCDAVKSMADDGHGTLFISTEGKGLCVLHTETGATEQYDNYQSKRPGGYICNNWVQSMCYDHSGLLWLGTSWGLSCFNPRTKRFDTFKWHNQLAGVACYSVAEYGKGNIVVGTDDGLYLFVRKQNKTIPFPHAESLRDKTIMKIFSEPNGDLWVSTSRGLWHYEAKAKRFVGHISNSGLLDREFVVKAGAKLADGRLVFANSDGLTLVNPREVMASSNPFGQLYPTNLYIGDRLVGIDTESNGSPIITEAIEKAREIHLSYLDNIFTLEFSTFSYYNPHDNFLQYRVNGEEWQSLMPGTNGITFNHLSPGKYKLEVRATNGVDLSKPYTLIIYIAAPWYRTWLAYIVYFLFFAVAVTYIYYRYSRRQKQRIAEEKMQLLINATHDLRTPLTLIINPLQKLRSLGTTEEQKRALDTIDNNVSRILNLVNQLLDIRKMDKGKMLLSVQETDLVPYLRHICKSFELNAKDHQINFTQQFPNKLLAWIDREQMDKVVTNLLSNAFKFTPDGGEICLRLNLVGDGKFQLQVVDSGIGLKESDRELIFKRFYQSIPSSTSKAHGTGIGLNLCRQIVELHHGTIIASNRTDGQRGSVFTVTMNVGKELFTAEEIKKVVNEEAPQVRSKTKYHVMLVDDDPEIISYMREELSPYYHITTCENGKQALSELLTHPYDLVVSDIMMPEMDGFTLLRTIKSNTLLSHIPVILLTSELSVGNRLEGLEKGCDAYLNKPFLMDELHATIDNLLRNRQALKGKFSGAVEQKEQVEQVEMKDNDKALMEKIMKSINNHISDEEFSVEQLAAEVGMSRVQIHRRMKEMTGLACSDFIRNIRLEQAARLITEKKVNVSQVAYSLGFSSPSYFSHVFKQHFGFSPSEYAKRNNE